MTEMKLEETIAKKLVFLGFSRWLAITFDGSD